MPIRTSFCFASLSLWLAANAQADTGNPLTTALEGTRPLVDVRMRSESVGQDGFSQDAEALTLRSRLGFETGKAWNTSLLAEADLMWPLEEHYNSTVNGLTRYPAVNDPENYSLNRLQLANRSLPQTTLILGRQRIQLDDQRFVGNSNWRQNEQTFDAVRMINQSIPKVTVDFTYLDQVNRVYTKNSPVGQYKGDSYLANVGWDTPVGKLTGFGYFLDLDKAPKDSSQTVGVRLAGAQPVTAFKLAYTLSYAKQQDYARNPLHYREDYYIAELIGSWRAYSLGGGVEMMEGDGIKGFTTPLASLHPWDGWADKFTTTPVNGVENRYVTAAYTKRNVGWLDSLLASASYQDYVSDHLHLHEGSEVDLLLQGKYQHFTGMVKYADYAADTFGATTRKFWLEVDYIW
jgi:hypothetical protein